MLPLKAFLRKIASLIVTFANPERVHFYPGIIFVISIIVSYVLMVSAGEMDHIEGYVLGHDFLSFYTTAHFFLEGNLHHLYDIDAQKSFHATLDGLNVVAGPFLNPPYASLLYAPFGLGSFSQGMLAWWGVGILFLISGLVLIYKNMLRAGIGFKNIALISLFFPPTIYWLAYGQATGIIFFILASTFVLLRKDREYSAGFMLGLLAFKPQLAIGMALPILIKGRWKAIIGGITSTSIWLMLGWWLFPDQMVQYWQERHEILGYIFRQGYPYEGIHSILGFSNLLFRGASPVLVYMAVWLFSMLAIGWLCWLWRTTKWDPSAPRWNLMMAISIVIGLSLAMQLFTYDLTLLLIPFFISLAYIPSKLRNTYLDAGPVFAWTVMIYITTYLSVAITREQFYLTELAFGTTFAVQLSTIAMIGWAISVHHFIKNEQLE